MLNRKLTYTWNLTDHLRPRFDIMADINVHKRNQADLHFNVMVTSFLDSLTNEDMFCQKHFIRFMNDSTIPVRCQVSMNLLIKNVAFQDEISISKY